MFEGFNETDQDQRLEKKAQKGHLALKTTEAVLLQVDQLCNMLIIST